MLKWQAKFWYQNRLIPLKPDENIVVYVCSKHKSYNSDRDEGKWSNFGEMQARRSGRIDGFVRFQIIQSLQNQLALF